MQQPQQEQQERQPRPDSAANIARRYKHLFRLPARNRTVLYSSIPTVLTCIISRLVLGSSPEHVVVYAVATELALLASIELDFFVLKGRNKVATFRRLASLAIIGNSFWFILALIALPVYFLTFSEIRFVSLLMLGAFFAVAFRALILGSLFYEKSWQGIPLSFLQPTLVLPTLLYGGWPGMDSVFGSPSLQSSVVGGLVALLSIEVYLFAINRTTKISTFRPLELLRAFLNAWAAEDAYNLERFLDATSREGSVSTQLLKLTSRNISNNGPQQKALLIVPGVHPGPFYPIGSSNLPGEIYKRLAAEGMLPLTVHSISDHDQNLPSKRQVERYVSSLKGRGNVVETGTRITEPVTRTRNKATVNGIGFGSSSVLLTITQAPHGMEDFPSEVREEIEVHARQMGFKNALVVDTHNSQGAKPSAQECHDAVAAAKEVINVLGQAPRQDFSVTFSHSSEMMAWVSADVGPAGVGLVLFQVGPCPKFCLVLADSNNSVLGFREKVLHGFESETGVRILELCTSDTHVTAAKTSDAKGYLALGDVLSPKRLIDLLVSLYERASSRTGEGGFSSLVLRTNVKMIGSEVLNDFSGLLDATSAVAKNGARILGILALIITATVALL